MANSDRDNETTSPRRVLPRINANVKVRVRVRIRKKRITKKKLLGLKKYTIPVKISQRESVNSRVGRKFLRLAVYLVCGSRITHYIINRSISANLFKYK